MRLKDKLRGVWLSHKPVQQMCSASFKHRLGPALALLGLLTGLGLLALLPGCAAPAGPRQSDYAREARWAAEFEPAVVVGDVVRLKQNNGHSFAAIWAGDWAANSAANSAANPVQKRAVVLVHSIGVHPDHGLTQALRVGLADAGYATLAIQAPIVDMSGVTDAGVYAGLMDEAAERIALGIAYARARGASQVFLVGHTSGAWMVNEYLGRRPADKTVLAWASLGMTGKFSSFAAHQLATLDVYTERGSAWTRTMAPQRLSVALAANAASEQHYLRDADLSMTGHERTLVQMLARFFGRF